MSLRNEQCRKVCRIIDDALANRPAERDSLIIAVQIAFETLERMSSSSLNCSEIPNNWISAKINPPKETETYLIQTETGYMCLCRWTNDITGFGNKYSEWRWHTMDKPQYSVVIAWMPLPAPYQPKEDES